MATVPQPTLEQLDRAHLIHPITEFRVHEMKGPRVIVGGKGIRLETARWSARVIDGFSGLFNINVGHGRTEIADAVAEQMRRLRLLPVVLGLLQRAGDPARRSVSRRCSPPIASSITFSSPAAAPMPTRPTSASPGCTTPCAAITSARRCCRVAGPITASREPREAPRRFRPITPSMSPSPARADLDALLLPLRVQEGPPGL